jgi:ATP-dependent protease ClpP protease subunit
MKQFGFALAESGESLDLDIYSVIGESFWFDAVSAASVLRRLKGSEGKAKTINVNIHSDGGDIFEASDIYFQLAEHSAKKVVRIGGLAASAASFVAMVGDEIIMGPAAWMMIHNPWGGAMGSAEKLIGWGETLLKARETYAGVYAARSKQSKEKCLEIMNAETWLTAEEAVKLGFADRIEGALAIPTEGKSRARAQRAFAAASLKDFNNVPEAVRELMKTARGELEQERQPAEPPAPQTPPAPAPAQKKPPANAGKGKTMDQSQFVSTIAITLGLPPGSTESDITAAAARLRDLEKEAVSLTGVKSTAEALGAVRGLKEKADKADALAAELQTVKAERDKQNFETLIVQGKAERKLTKALADKYLEEFNAAAAEGRGEEVVARLRGHLPLMGAAIPSRDVRPPAPGGGEGAVAIKWNDKEFRDLGPQERANLKASEPELYATMRRDWEAAGSPLPTTQA